MIVMIVVLTVVLVSLLQPNDEKRGADMFEILVFMHDISGGNISKIVAVTTLRLNDVCMQCVFLPSAMHKVACR